MAIQKVTLDKKFNLFSEQWKPKIIAELNDSHVKIAKLKGDFVWHRHEREDEMFLVMKGNLTIKLRDQNITLKPGELVVIPKGVEHKPVADEEVQLMMIEPKTTLNTGNVQNERTALPEWI